VDVFACIQNDTATPNLEWESWIRDALGNHLKILTWFSIDEHRDWASLRDKLISHLNLAECWKNYITTSGSMIEYYQLYLAYLKMCSYEDTHQRYKYIIRVRTDTIFAKPIDFHWLLLSDSEVEERIRAINCALIQSNIEVTPQNTLSYFMSTIISDSLIPNIQNILTRYIPNRDCVAAEVTGVTTATMATTVTDAVAMNEYIKTGEKYAGASISWKNLQYLWKHFLNSQKIPTVIYQTQLKSILIQRLHENYMVERDTFQNIFSKYLPEIQKFVQFWDEIMIVDDNEYELELEEIRNLFNKWAHMKRESVIGINEQQIIELIQHFYPEVEIENDKYIQHIRCSIWNKKLDIKIALEEFKNKIRSENNENDTGNISTYDAYIFYCKYYSYCNLESKDIVNKSYFDKYIVDNFTEFIVDGVFISRTWLENLL
jgi:hypothetical protein